MSGSMGVFQLESCEDFRVFSSNQLAKIPRKVVVSVRPLFSQVVRSSSICIIMGVAKWEQDIRPLSLFCESVMWEQFWPFLIKRPLGLYMLQKNYCGGYACNHSIEFHFFVKIRFSMSLTGNCTDFEMIVDCSACSHKISCLPVSNLA